MLGNRTTGVREGSRSRALVTAAIMLLALVFAAGASGTSRPANGHGRIVGGQATTIAQWPWQVAIVSTGSGSAYDRQFCGGTLVAPKVVLTAAHCVYEDRTRTFTPASQLSVVAGRTNLSASRTGQEIRVSRVDVLRKPTGAPYYNANATTFDAEVLELASPATTGRAIKIAGASEGSLWTGGRKAYVTGWGSTVPSSGGYPNGLRVAQINIYPDAQCLSKLSSIFKSSTMMCAGAPPTTDTCDGDSGGPLVVPIAGGDYRLVGSTSWGLSEKCGLHPSAYARLAADPLRSLIRNKVLQVSGVDIVGSGALPPSR